MPAMLGCNTICPNCKHQFSCCQPAPPASCCSVRRSMHVLSGGGLVTTTLAPPISSPCLSPQISPSVQLAFVLPPFTLKLPTPPPSPEAAQPETELERVANTARALRQSGWYYEGITYEKSNELLKNTKVGTFLVRNSSDPRFIFSLSVQTDRGPTSVRLCFVDGFFRLDAQPHLQSVMPRFQGVIELVQHYVKHSKSCRNDAQVWVDPQGKLYSPIVLDKPLRKEGELPALKHLTRLAVNKALCKKMALLPPPCTQLELPASLEKYLADYPYAL